MDAVKSPNVQSDLLGAFLWPLTVIRIWINLVADQFANSKRPSQYQNQSALLLDIKAIELNLCELGFEPLAT